MPAWNPESISSSSGAPERRSDDSDRAATLGLGPQGGAKRSQGAAAVSASIAMPLASKVHALGHISRNPVLFAMELHRRELTNYFRILTNLLRKTISK